MADAKPSGVFGQIGHLVHTHVWFVHIDLTAVPPQPAQQQYRSPAIDFRPQMLPLISRANMRLNISIDHKNGHRVRVLPPTWTGQRVEFHTAITIETPGQTSQTEPPHLHANGCLTPKYSDWATLRLPPGTERIRLRHCAVYRAHRTHVDQLLDQLGSTQPRRTWLRSSICSPSRGYLFSGADDTKQHFAMASYGWGEFFETIMAATMGRLDDQLAAGKDSEKPHLFEAQFHVPHAPIAERPWRLRIRHLKPGSLHDGDVDQLLSLYLEAPDGVDMAGNTVRLDLFSVSQPLDARQSIAMVVARNKVLKISVPQLLAAMQRGDQFACELHATTVYLVSPQAAQLWHNDVPAMQKYCDEIQFDRQTMESVPTPLCEDESTSSELALEHRVHWLQSVFRPLLGDASSGDWTLRLNGGQTAAIAVHSTVMWARAPELCKYLQSRWPDAAQCVFDVDVLCLGAADLRRLLAHIYALDGMQECDEPLQLMCVASAFGLGHLEREAQLSWLLEQPRDAEGGEDRQMRVLRMFKVNERRRIWDWRATQDVEW